MKWKWDLKSTDTCCYHYLGDEEGNTILEVTDVTTIDNPDLKLIQAAPEMREALVKLIQVAEQLPQPATEEGLELCAALAKARGVIDLGEPPIGLNGAVCYCSDEDEPHTHYRK